VIDYMFKRWPPSRAFWRADLLDEQRSRTRDPRDCGWAQELDVAGSDESGHRAAAMYAYIETCHLNDVDPRAWLADILRCLNKHPQTRLHELLP
jgi:hypothetical protein